MIGLWWYLHIWGPWIRVEGWQLATTVDVHGVLTLEVGTDTLFWNFGKELPLPAAWQPSGAQFSLTSRRKLAIPMFLVVSLLHSNVLIVPEIKTWPLFNTVCKFTKYFHIQRYQDGTRRKRLSIHQKKIRVNYSVLCKRISTFILYSWRDYWSTTHKPLWK
jgi:hypothetical protein